jgi:hypothetical protein
LRINALYVIFPSSSKCEQYVRHNRQYELAFLINQLDKLSEQKNKLLNQIIKNKTRTRRLRKQRRLLLKKMRNLNDRKAQNIFELKIDKILSKIPIKPAKILNPFSPRFFSFLNFALLDFPDRISAEPFNN